MSRFQPASDRPEAELGLGLDFTLNALRALAEETRLRILALLFEGELSVSDLTDILSQSQPRISRHLKVLVEAGLVERNREGAWAFFRLADRGAARLLMPVLSSLDRFDARLAEDRERLAAVREARARAAQAFFARLAPQWDGLRSLHVSEEAVEAAILETLGERPLDAMLDLGTGTGRMLQLLGVRAARAVGLDANHAMLSVARANLERAGLARAELRQGDIYAPPFWRGSFDLVVIHQVLHYLDDPARAVAEAARLVAPGGRLLIVDFAPHGLEFLREQGGHRRLGFAAEQVSGWLAEAGIRPSLRRDLAPPAGDRDQLTVSLWLGEAPRLPASAAHDIPKTREIA
jgi:ubiquinone/menaquinone biosynthesis C-methylase UbiE/DNA-binding transcriptional ArsR family regulator